MNSTTAPTSHAPLYRLALGTFVAGTESFMIAGFFCRHGGRPAYQHCRYGSAGHGVCLGRGHSAHLS